MKVLMRSVDMICCTSKDGIITPIKFRIADEEKEYKIIRIDKILTRDEEKLAGNRMLVFKVQSIINNCEWLFEMKYEFSTCKWFLYKI
ncbi:MAG: hypothetical protein PHC69_11080 [Ruminiclostridium sp.]|jgi:hypothetical protein|nr:hypothetical protein [Ruminiclostridium sp.]